jgi:hypothetical protein
MKYTDFDAMTPAELNAWYENAVGYKPQEDCPDITDDELRELCADFERMNAASGNRYGNRA